MRADVEEVLDGEDVVELGREGELTEFDEKKKYNVQLEVRKDLAKMLKVKDITEIKNHTETISNILKKERKPVRDILQRQPPKAKKPGTCAGIR